MTPPAISFSHFGIHVTDLAHHFFSQPALSYRGA